MPSAKEGRKGTPSRTVSGKFKKVAPLISSGMMKKLEPVLQFEKRTMHCHPLGTIKPLNAPQDDIQSKKQKDPGEFCFPSSPARENNKEEATSFKGEREKEIKLTKKAAKKAEKVLKRYANKEVLENIRNTREHIQLLRSQLQENKNWAEQQRFH
ncbi:uncharacterized protein LOC144631880 [Oculina patagonica]